LRVALKWWSKSMVCLRSVPWQAGLKLVLVKLGVSRQSVGQSADASGAGAAKAALVFRKICQHND